MARTAHGAWRMAHGAWRMAHGAWRIAQGAWRMARMARMEHHLLVVRYPNRMVVIYLW